MEDQSIILKPKRNWVRSLIILGLVFGLPFLHPLVRQLVFGPKVDGVPICIWEDAFRDVVHKRQPKKYTTVKLLHRYNLTPSPQLVWIRPDVFRPVFISLAEDHDEDVRHEAIKRLTFGGIRDEEVPLFQRRLDDADPRCRFVAAKALWRKTKEPVCKKVIKELTECDDPESRKSANAWIQSTEAEAAK